MSKEDELMDAFFKEIMNSFSPVLGSKTEFISEQDIPPELLKFLESRFTHKGSTVSSEFEIGTPFFVDLDKPKEYSLDSAHYKVNVVNAFPDSSLERLHEVDNYIDSTSHKKAALKYGLNFGNIIASMFLEESGLTVSPDNIVRSSTISRITMDNVFAALAGKRDKIGLSLPNWHLWSKKIYSKRYKFHYFQAETEDQLVSGFEKDAKKMNALVIVNPANPLMYRMSESAAKRIDEIAQKYGVEIVIDEVLRGTQPLGERQSLAEHFTRSYVIEGFSKRFGDRPLGDVSYVLVPEDDTKVRAAIKSNGNYLDVELLNEALKHGTKPAIYELEQRNAYLKKGIQDSGADIQILSPSKTNLVSRLIFPKEWDNLIREGCAFCQALDDETKIKMQFTPDFYPKKHGKDVMPLARITVGLMEAEHLYQAGYSLGTLVANSKPRR